MATVADVSRLRLYVRVPQAFSGRLVRGTQAMFTVPDRPGEVFEATLSRLSEAVDRQSGAMLVEFLVDNGARRLRPGSYAEVRVSVPGGAETVQVPASGGTAWAGPLATISLILLVVWVVMATAFIVFVALARRKQARRREARLRRLERDRVT